MTEDYHQKEQALNTAPNVIDGIPMKYKHIVYDLTLKPLKDTKLITDDTQEQIGNRDFISGDIQRLMKAIKETTDIKKMK